MLGHGSLLILTAEKVPGIKSSGQNLLEFFGIILVFIIVLVACWATTRFIASRQLSGKNTGNFEVVETYAIARDRFLQLVRIGTRYYAIAVGKDSINVIGELSAEELDLEKKTGSVAMNGFSSILTSLVKKHDIANTPADEDKIDK